jgi:hypothetical protein
MKYAVVLLIANVCLAQVKIKGHQIGENAADFLKTEPFNQRLVIAMLIGHVSFPWTK